ncbi:hypothetical protein COO60DRAFT_1138821 [Scenedesmus sp. NREL 46B-D3]|nr:hypothetical protein COO60DRAFT_1138821 [Scenedesmus sp. NREL 46B-D3]
MAQYSGWSQLCLHARLACRGGETLLACLLALLLLCKSAAPFDICAAAQQCTTMQLEQSAVDNKMFTDEEHSLSQPGQLLPPAAESSLNETIRLGSEQPQRCTCASMNKRYQCGGTHRCTAKQGHTHNTLSVVISA